MKILRVVSVLVCCCGLSTAMAQVGIGTTSPSPKAVLELRSPGNDQGFLVPRLTTAQRNAITGLGAQENGLMVFDSDDQKFYYWQNTQWLPLRTGSDAGVVAGTGISITGNTISAIPDGDGNAANEIQDLQLAGNTLKITNNASATAIDLSPYVNVDGSATNEIQDLQLTGNALKITNNAAATTVDLSPYVQDLQLTGSTLKITNNASATAIDLSPFAGGDDQTLTFTSATGNLAIAGGNNVTITGVTPGGTAGGDLTGTFPNPTIANNAISTSKITPSSTNGQVLTTVGGVTQWATPAAPIGAAGGDLSGSYPNPSIAADAVTSAKIVDGTIAAADLNTMGATSGQVLKYNGTAWAPATDAGVSTTLTSGNILVGNASNTAAAVVMSGDATISNAGAVTIANNAITSAKINDGTVVSADIADGTIAAADLNAMGATNGQVLKYNGTTWTPSTDAGISTTLSSGNILVGNATNTATAVTMSGDATISNAGAVTIANNAITSAKINDGTVASADIADGTIAAADLNAMGAANGQVLKYNGTTWMPSTDAGISTTLSSGNILVGNATNTATAVAMGGDATISNAGVVTIANNAITSAKINDGTVASADIADGTIGAVDLNAMGAANGQVLKYNGTAWAPATDAGISTILASGNILVGNATNTATAVTMSGDAVISNTGAVTIANSAITSAKINDGTIAAADLSAMGAASNQVLKYNGTVWAPAADDGISTTLAGGNILVGNTSNTASSVAMSGDATISNVGVVTIANNAITSAKINDGTIVTADIADGTIAAADLNAMGATNGQVLKYNGTTWTPSTDAGISTTLSSGNILVGNATNTATAVTMSGDATISNAGVITIGTGAVSSGKIADGTIAAADLNSMGAATNQVLKYNGTAWAPGTDVDTDTDQQDISNVLSRGNDAGGNEAHNFKAITVNWDYKNDKYGSLSVNGSQFVSFTSVNADYAVKSTDYLIIGQSVSAAGAPIKVALPSAASNTGRIIIIRSTGSSASQGIIVTSTDGIDGNANSETLYYPPSNTIGVAYSLTVISDGKFWWTIHRDMGPNKG